MIRSSWYITHPGIFLLGWGNEPWHPPMLVPCEPNGSLAIDRCRPMRWILRFVGEETQRIMFDAVETCPICGHVRARRVPAPKGYA